MTGPEIELQALRPVIAATPKARIATIIPRRVNAVFIRLRMRQRARQESPAIHPAYPELSTGVLLWFATTVRVVVRAGYTLVAVLGFSVNCEGDQTHCAFAGSVVGSQVKETIPLQPPVVVAVKVMEVEDDPAVRLRLLGATTTALPFTKAVPELMVYDCPVISSTMPVTEMPEPVIVRSHGWGGTSATLPLTAMPGPVIVRTPVEEAAATTFVKPAFVNDVFRAVAYAATVSLRPIGGATLFTDDRVTCRLVEASTISFAGKVNESTTVGTIVVVGPALATMPEAVMFEPVIVSPLSRRQRQQRRP